MAKIATRTVKGGSGEEYEFNVYVYPTGFKEVGGVYILSERYEKDGKFYHKNLYVGITDDMDERHTDHERGDDFVEAGANSISFHREEDEDERERIEEDILANGQSWPLNTQRS